jgi:hypothetical protein
VNEQLLNQQITAWNTAAMALARDDANGIHEALRPRGDPADAWGVFNEMLGMAVLGARLAAVQVLAVVPEPDTPPAPGFRRKLNMFTLDPREEPPAAQRVAGQAVLMASESDLNGVINLVLEWTIGTSSENKFPDRAGAQRLADLTLHLLLIYVQYSHQEEGTHDQP